MHPRQRIEQRTGGVDVHNSVPLQRENDFVLASSSSKLPRYLLAKDAITTTMALTASRSSPLSCNGEEEKKDSNGAIIVTYKNNNNDDDAASKNSQSSVWKREQPPGSDTSTTKTTRDPNDDLIKTKISESDSITAGTCTTDHSSNTESPHLQLQTSSSTNSNNNMEFSSSLVKTEEVTGNGEQGITDAINETQDENQKQPPQTQEHQHAFPANQSIAKTPTDTTIETTTAMTTTTTSAVGSSSPIAVTSSTASTNISTNILVPADEVGSEIATTITEIDETALDVVAAATAAAAPTTRKAKEVSFVNTNPTITDTKPASTTTTTTTPNRSHHTRNNNNNNKNHPTRNNSRQVKFHDITIRLYPMTLGYNPACQWGAPVELDWNYDELPGMNIDDYERRRKKTRRTKLHQLVLSSYRRRDILLALGYDEQQQKDASKDVAKTQWQRSKTKLFLPLSKVEEVAQSAGRKAKRIGGGRKGTTTMTTKRNYPTTTVTTNTAINSYHRSQ